MKLFGNHNDTFAVTTAGVFLIQSVDAGPDFEWEKVSALPVDATEIPGVHVDLAIPEGLPGE